MDIPDDIRKFFYGSLSADHFELVKIEKQGSLNKHKTFAKCLLCKTDKLFTGDTTSNGNFIKHIKVSSLSFCLFDKILCHEFKFILICQLVHFETWCTNYQDSSGNRRKRAKLREKSQPTLDSFSLGTTPGKQKLVERAIVEYVVKSMKPLSTVECPHFRNLIQSKFTQTLMNTYLNT